MAQKSKNPVTVFQFLFSFFFFSSSFVFLCQAANTITKGQSIIDGDTLESVDGNFELGFFSPENSTSRYLGIRYGKIQEQSVIWIANRDKPILSRNGSFTISQDGNLIVTDGNGISVWSSDASILSNNTTAILEKTGNLVLSSRDSIGDLSKAYWQSFDDPTDTYLPDMKVPASSTGGANVVFTSWKSATDPSPGNFTMGIDPRGSPQIVICDQNSIRVWRSGHWNGLVFIGVPEMVTVTNYQYGFKYTRENDGNWYFTYHPSNPSDLMRFELTWDGFEEQLKWNQSGSKWESMQKQPFDVCDHYNYCGNFGVCTAQDSPKCDCMEGFQPKDRDQWSRGNWSGGCVRKSSLQCQRNASVEGETGDDGFKMFNGMKLPDFGDLERKATSRDNCKEICLQNCSCSAFAYVGGIGCMLWQGELIDVQHFEKSGNNLYLRLAESEFGERRISAGVVVAIVAGGVIFLAICIWLLCRLKTRLQVLPPTTAVSNTRKSDTPITDVSEGKGYSTELSGQVDFIEGSHLSSQDLPLFSFSCVEAATDKFSEENKLGQGGFGLVYKGKLPGGEEIAVKRLSRISGQGLEEFKNEITLIAKLQHRNLVRLLGWCVQGEEKILLYEYMPNKSLDFFLFDSEKQPLLDWQKRFAIIEGIARGLLYLHRDSRLRIIHRDLKASNILLDEEMTPKISDFGMARIFAGNQNEANTNRVVGTYGYMAPEYAMEGLFSVKSDVYSFGVLLLEIVSGRRNTSYRSTDHICLIGYAWNLWTERKIAELIDPSIRDACDESQVSRCIQVGMLCVQDSAFHRPTMATVVLMLESSNTTLPLPRQPSTFTSNRTCIDSDIFTDGHEIASSNELTVTMVTGR